MLEFKIPSFAEHILTDKAEALGEFQRLTKLGFEIRRPQPLLDEKGLIDTLSNSCKEIQVRRIGQSSDDLNHNYLEAFFTIALEDPSEAFKLLKNDGYAPYVVGPLITEDEFVEIATARGTVDLTRVPLTNGKPVLDKKGRMELHRYFGIHIGSPNREPIIFAYLESIE